MKNLVLVQRINRNMVNGVKVERGQDKNRVNGPVEITVKKITANKIERTMQKLCINTQKLLHNSIRKSY